MEAEHMTLKGHASDSRVVLRPGHHRVPSTGCSARKRRKRGGRGGGGEAVVLLIVKSISIW